ncbi:MAG: PD40 domain-containing protein [Flavobacteriales bacterium]|nr:PD40 domain-containing protein [Flavobacteriales bacterium]
MKILKDIQWKSSLCWMLCLLPVFGWAQDCPKASKKAQSVFDEAVGRWKYDRKNAMADLQALAEKEPGFTELQLFIGEELYKEGDRKTCYKYFQKAVESCPSRDPYAFYRMGEVAYTLERYDKATKLMEEFFKYPQAIRNEQDKRHATKLLENARFYDGVFKNPVPFEPKAIEDICTEMDEYLAAISPDDGSMYFTRAFDRKTMGLPIDRAWEVAGADRVERFSRSYRVNGKFEKGEPLTPPFNTNYNEGGPTVSIDNRELYFTVCDGNRNCDIYYTLFSNGAWGPIRNMGEHINDPVQWDSQPSISSDGQTLYFSSLRAGGMGGADIYMCTRNANGTWNEPVNMGAPINTPGNEKSPFIHTDSQTLYFSSDGHVGLGGFDIFLTRMDKNTGKWSVPKNIGYPINTDKDDLGFFVSTDGQTAYFASNTIKEGKGGYDIYGFPLYKEAQPEKVLFVKGELKDEAGEPVKDARVELKSMKSKDVTEVKVNKETGEYVAAVTVDEGEDYVLSVKQKDKAFNAVYLETKKPEPIKPVTINFEMQEVKVGEAYRLNDIVYATNSFELTAEAMSMIDEFIGYLTDNPRLKVAIHGHTDNQGDPVSNKELSTNRAKSVYQYLIIEGVDPDRLSYKGFGQDKPVASNKTEEGRGRNRRTEFVIVGK